MENNITYSTFYTEICQTQELINTFNDRENNILCSSDNSAGKIIGLWKFIENLNVIKIYIECIYILNDKIINYIYYFLFKFHFFYSCSKKFFK